MSIDIDSALRFNAAHARVLDRHRLRLALGEPAADAALGALEGYRNPDGGYGWGLEPDLRAPESQPGCALHAFEVFEEAAPVRSPRAVELCDWMQSVSLDDGGVPFALPVADASGTAPFWADADHTTSSLHITAAVTAVAHRVGRTDPAVAEHPWLRAATRFCLDSIATAELPMHAIELKFTLEFLDAVHESAPEAAGLLARLGETIPPDGRLHVDGGTEDEYMRPLDFAPFPDRPVRALFRPEAVAADLDRVAGLQQDDGGWPVEFVSYSPAAELEWRGYFTVWAVTVLRANRLAN